MKLFWRIFLSFWLATILMLTAIRLVTEFFPMTFPGDHVTRFEPDLIRSDLAQAVEAYETGGHAALTSQLQSLSALRDKPLYLFDQAGRELIGNGTPPPLYGLLVRDVLQSGHAEVQRYFRTQALFVCPIQSAGGRRYAAIVTAFDPSDRLVELRSWFNLAIAMLSTALVCMVLSLYLTRPITRLRATAQRLAGGDLEARAAPPGIRRRDELGDLARDFNAMAGQIQLLMTAQRRFVADVSHELGAPLTRMHLALALLRRQFAGKNIAEIQRIERETDKLSNLVQQLLLLAGLEAGRCPAETLAPVSIRSLCEGIIEDANFEAAHSQCQVTGSHQDVNLLVYPHLLRRAIDNVLRNAIRYAPAGTSILLNCGVDEDRQLVILEILDSGPGVPESMLADIFRPFFRTDPGRETSSGGTGLGLAIAAEAIRLHDGAIAAENRASGGLRISILLPFKVPAPEEESQPATAGI
jgi:two-component system sensor histidine kinase CpxA